MYTVSSALFGDEIYWQISVQQLLLLAGWLAGWLAGGRAGGRTDGRPTDRPTDRSIDN